VVTPMRGECCPGAALFSGQGHDRPPSARAPPSNTARPSREPCTGVRGC
jgi:hypothetical protein